jgi:HAD superfamily phosphoserine phosphatase-like hydrolase
MPTLPPWLKPFSPPFRRAVLEALRRKPAGPRLACFDADGTLWSEDIGEAFFRWLIASDRLPALRGQRDIYEAYEARVREDRTAGYAWAVQAMAGNREEDVLEWSRWLVAAWPNVRPAMVGLVRGLQAEGVETWIVSASNLWTIRAAAPFVGFDSAQTMGIAVRARDGVLTDEVVRPVVCMEGKVEAIRARFGADPLLAVGDSLGDLAMLESAACPLVVGRRDQKGAALLGIAAQRGWAVHLF